MMIKKKKFFAAMLTALTASVVAPMTMGTTAFATTTPPAQGGGSGTGSTPGSTGDVNFNVDPYKNNGIIFSEESCKDGCKGHKVSGTLKYSTGYVGNPGDGIYGIYVKSGSHKIYFEDVTLDFSDPADKQGCAMKLGSNAKVDLMLSGKSNLTSGNASAGIWVPRSASLTISEGKQDGSATEGTLTVKGGSEQSAAAGIGGAGGGEEAWAGDITIKGGTIKATGGNNSAGIGGSASGFNKITISGGTVRAEGGSNACGIGFGGSASDEIKRSGGEIKIEGDAEGKIEAVGGLNPGRTIRTEGIGCNSLTSDVGNRFDIETTGQTGDLTDFNGLLWTYGDKKGSDGKFLNELEDPTWCQVYGNATLTAGLEKFGKQITSQLFIPPNCSITIPSDRTDRWEFYGTIDGSGSIVNANLFNRGSATAVASTIIEKVTFVPLVDAKVAMEGNKNTVDFTYQDLTDTVVAENDERKRDTYSDDSFLVDKTGWWCKIEKAGIPKAIFEQPLVDSAGNKVKKEGILDAGTYNVSYYYKSGDKITDNAGPFRVIVNAVSLVDNCTYNNNANPIIPDQEYTGTEIKPVVTVKFGQRELTEGTDYSYKCTYEGGDLDGEEFATASVEISPVRGNGNFKDTKKIEFRIVRASISGAEVGMKTASEVPYDGKPHEPEIEVRMNGTILTAGTDYDAQWKSNNNDKTFTDADTYTLTVTGKGNYAGTAQQNVSCTIVPKTVRVSGAKAINRQYDGSNIVAIEELRLNPADIVEKDRDEVKTESGMSAEIVDEAGNPVTAVGTYSNYKFDQVTLTGKRGHCYVAQVDPEQEYDAVEITQKDAPAISVKDVEYEPDETGEKFVIKAIIPHLEDKSLLADKPDYPADPYAYPFAYEYIMDEGKEGQDAQEWKPLEALGTTPETTIMVEPREKHTFKVRATDPAGNIMPTGESAEFEKEFVLKDRPAPVIGSATLSDPKAADAYDHDQGTYTLRINTDLTGIEYSFDDGEEKTVSDDPIKTGCLPKTQYTGYIRYKATKVYNASPFTATEPVTTDPATVDPPQIGDAGTEFRGSKQVFISCKPADADIYYTTNGTDPSEVSKKIKSGESFKIGEEEDVDSVIEVRAFAMKAGMENSEIVSATFTKTGEEEYRIRTTLIEGISKEDITSGLEDAGYGTAESIEARFRQVLSSFGFEDIAFYDIRVTRKIDGKWTKLTEKNFPEDGLTVTVDCPAGLSTESYDFAVSHMHAYDSDRLGVDAGTTEQPKVTKTEDGRLQFEITSASPLAIAWKTATPDNPDDPNNPDNPDDPNNPDNPTNPDDPNNTQDPTQDPNQTTTDPNNQSQGNDQTSNGRSADQASGNGTTTGTNAGTQGASNDAAGTLSNLMPKTGDPLSFVPWIAAAVISVGAIVFFATRKNGKKAKKKQTVKKTQATKKKR